ncbi:fungal-specific transcription factor domain-containing protein [Aspergillus varians]
MSLSTGQGLYQPFQCLICQSRFTRHENLKRHALLHSRSQDEAVLPCHLCQATFSRPDLRNRHMKRKHPDQVEQRRARKRTQRELSASRQWSDEDQGKGYSVSPRSDDCPPSLEDNRLESNSGWHGLRVTDVRAEDRSRDISELMQQAMSEPRIDKIGQDVMDLQTLLEAGPSLLSPDHVAASHHSPDFTGFGFSFEQDWSPSPAQITRGCDLFFAHVSHFLPFLHQPTFAAGQVPLQLLLSMLCLAYQYGDDPENNCPGEDLSKRCFHRARALLATTTDAPEHSLPTVQSFLLLQICAMMYLCGADSAHALKMHSVMISLARTGGLMQPAPVEPSSTQDLDTLWHAFIKAESHKRTLFAVHQIDALWYQVLSIPRSISHLEIKHDLPCPQDHWTAPSSAEWAHRQLVQKQGPAVQYAEAVRRFLSQDSSTDISSIPAFDPYGAINITQFLISSAREISGWSTMTGMLSIDRFGALRSSLVTLNPFICPSIATSISTPSSTASPGASEADADPKPRIENTLCTATWQTAMIELQIWSPSHTSGIVEASIDAVLSQSTYLSPSPAILCEEITAKAIQPHVDWFLRYLDTTVSADGEAPWVALYAYRAFLIAWQLVRGRLPGAMSVVGVEDGDVHGAVEWARMVFGRRAKWTVGRLICTCLDGLPA